MNKNYIYISVLLALFLSPSRLISYFSYLSSLPLYMVTWGIAFNIMMIGLTGISGVKLTKIEKRLLFIYTISSLYLVFIVYYLNPTFVVRGYLKSYLIGLGLFLTITNKKFDKGRFLQIFLNVSVIISFFSLIVYLGVYFEVMPLKKIYLPGHISPYFSGILGFANCNEWHLIRNQSYFSEPAKFAQFLQISLFLLFHKTFIDKNRKYLLKLIIISLAFFTTFSVANLFGLIFSLMFFSIFSLKFNFKKFVVFLLLIASLICVGKLFYEATNISNRESVIAKNTDINFENRSMRFDVVLEAVKENPLGNVKTLSWFHSNPTLYGNILIKGGWPYLFLFILFITFFYIEFFSMVRKKNLFVLYGFIGFFVAFSWYGSFLEGYFIFLIVIYLEIIRAEKNNNSILHAI